MQCEPLIRPAVVRRRLEVRAQIGPSILGLGSRAFSKFMEQENMRGTNELALLPKLPLLITESADEFSALRDAFEREIKPRGIIEQMYVHDICSIVWEILRLRRCKVVIINSAFRSALEDILKQLLRQPGQSEYDVRDEAEALAHAWFTNKEAKSQVSEILSQFKLDEVAIEAEAIRRSSS